MRKREAAQRLRLSVHTFKALTSGLGVARWPHRSIASVAHVTSCLEAWGAGDTTGTVALAICQLAGLLAALQAPPCDEVPESFRALAAAVVRLRFNARNGRYGNAASAAACKAGAEPLQPAALADGAADGSEPGPPPPLSLLLADLEVFLHDSAASGLGGAATSAEASFGASAAQQRLAQSEWQAPAWCHGVCAPRKRRATQATAPTAFEAVASRTRRQRG